MLKLFHKTEETVLDPDKRTVPLEFFKVDHISETQIGPFPDVGRNILIFSNYIYYHCGVDTYEESYDEGGRIIPYIFKWGDEDDIIEIENIDEWAYIDHLIEGKAK